MSDDLRRSIAEIAAKLSKIEEGDDPEIIVPGYGTMTVNTLKRDVRNHLVELNSAAEGDNYKRIYHSLYKQEILKIMLEALIDYENQQNQE